MSAGNLSVYGEWLVQEASGCTCCGISPHETGCGYEPLVKVEEISDAFKSAGYAVIKLPVPHKRYDGALLAWPVAQTWQGRPDRDGEVSIRVSDGRITATCVSIPCNSPDDARSFAAALLAAADAAEAMEK